MHYLINPKYVAYASEWECQLHSTEISLYFFFRLFHQVSRQNFWSISYPSHACYMFCSIWSFSFDCLHCIYA